MGPGLAGPRFAAIGSANTQIDTSADQRKHEPLSLVSRYLTLTGHMAKKPAARYASWECVVEPNEAMIQRYVMFPDTRTEGHSYGKRR